MLAEVHIATSLINSGAKDIVENFSADAQKTVLEFLAVVIPGSLAIWGTRAPITKGVNWLKSQVFKRG